MEKKLLFLLNFLCKGSEVSLVILLPFFQKDFTLSLFQIGFLGTVMVLTQVITIILVGKFVHKIGSVRLVSFSVLLLAMAWLGLLVASYYYLLIVVFVIAGIGLGIFEPLGNSLAALFSQKDNRAKEIGNVEVFGDMGRIGISALTTLLVASISWHYLALVYGVFSLAIFVGYFLITNFVNKFDSKINDKQSKTTFMYFFHERRYLLALISGVLDSFASSSIYIFIPFLLVYKRFPLATVGLYLSVFFGGYLLGRMFLGRIADKKGTASLFMVSEILMVIAIIALVVSNQSTITFGIMFLLGAFTRGTSPIVKAMVAESIDKADNFHKGYSLYSFLSRSSSIFSRFIFGLTAGYIGIVSVFYIASIFALLAIIPAWIFKNESPTS